MRTDVLAVMLIICVIASSAMLPVAAAEDVLVTITSPAVNEVTGSNVTVSWESDPGMERCRIWVDGAELSNIGTSGSVEVPNLADGLHVVVARSYNGTVSGMDTVAFFVDTSGPELAILAPSYGDDLNSSDVTVRWSASDPSSIARYAVEVMMNGAFNQTIALDHTASEVMLKGLENADYLVTITAFDGTGDSTRRSVAFSVDTTVPSLNIISPDGARTFDGKASIQVTWEASDAGGNIEGFKVFLNGAYQTTVAAAADSFLFTDLRDGEYTVEVVAVDSANNTDRDSTSFNIDSVPFGVVSTFPGDGAIMGTDIRVAYTKPLDREVSNITVSGVKGMVEWDGITMTFTPNAPLALGTSYTVEAVARDHSGRWANTTWSFNTTSMAYVTGTVLDADGSPLANARVFIPGGSSTATDEGGAFRLLIPSGNQTLTVSLSGYITRTMPVNIAPGTEGTVGTIKLASSDLITLVGWAVAILAIILVLLVYYVRRNRRRNRRRPPARRGRGKEASRSWKGLEQLQKRSNRNRYEDSDIDPDDRL